MERCEKCGLMHGDRRRCSYDVFVEALAGFELTEGDKRLLRWLASYDQEVALVSLFTRLGDIGTSGVTRSDVLRDIVGKALRERRQGQSFTSTPARDPEGSAAPTLKKSPPKSPRRAARSTR